ncbi:unnamed protein product [Didymodactylos carnosus]|uniref:Uncharacterized protein n=1 Tax=Didymodactylos carnosus TaxID=1234261 RepID=A0A813UX90_9BILA|nr:unnamed protein product [Didymodactylos carnosus]CAF1226599.1 unnamed protein product [Didymodactylos carnosus]CAF3616343.1 unnamed protein product [Didymodactylos carnosus]CAF4034672.1 unnamed protein product [Didymodactylos carnosus]
MNYSLPIYFVAFVLIVSAKYSKNNAKEMSSRTDSNLYCSTFPNDLAIISTKTLTINVKVSWDCRISNQGIINNGNCATINYRQQVDTLYLHCLPLYLPQIFCLKNLQLLNISGCHEQWEIPLDIVSITNLKNLSLVQIQLHDMSKIVQLRSPLTYLDLSKNQITTILSEITTFSKTLTHLILSENRLQNVPIELVSMEKLEYLNIKNNWFTDDEKARIRNLFVINKKIQLIL